jgi:hypothetical protein
MKLEDIKKQFTEGMTSFDGGSIDASYNEYLKSVSLDPVYRRGLVQGVSPISSFIGDLNPKRKGVLGLGTRLLQGMTDNTPQDLQLRRSIASKAQGQQMFSPEEERFIGGQDQRMRSMMMGMTGGVGKAAANKQFAEELKAFKRRLDSMPVEEIIEETAGMNFGGRGTMTPLQAKNYNTMSQQSLLETLGLTRR